MAVQPGSIDRQGLQTGRAVAVTGAQEEPRSRGRLLRRIGFVALLLLFTVLFLYPFLWLVSASLKTTAEVFDGRLFPAS
jgi:multiple sugar transport system permease protein